MQQGIEFTEGLTRMAWFLLVLLFDITHRQTGSRCGYREKGEGCNPSTNYGKYIGSFVSFVYTQEPIYLP